MTIVTRITVLSLMMVLGGCSFFSSSTSMRDKEYLSARSIPPLRVPPGIATSSFHAAYPVSDRQYSRSAEEVSLVPPGLSRG
jgi:uncharacterized lipoprotein